VHCDEVAALRSGEEPFDSMASHAGDCNLSWAMIDRDQKIAASPSECIHTRVPRPGEPAGQLPIFAVASTYQPLAFTEARVART
jgi:hypothetical protein